MCCQITDAIIKVQVPVHNWPQWYFKTIPRSPQSLMSPCHLLSGLISAHYRSEAVVGSPHKHAVQRTMALTYCRSYCFQHQIDVMSQSHEPRLRLIWVKYSPTFTVCWIPVDGGIATLAFTFCFSIPVFTLRVFSTNESLCAEVITWKIVTKKASIYFGLKICSLKAMESFVHTHTKMHTEIKADKCTNEQPGSCFSQNVDEKKPTFCSCRKISEDVIHPTKSRVSTFYRTVQALFKYKLFQN